MNEKILIFGNGQIGNFYLNYFKGKSVPASIAQGDITKSEDVEKAIGAFQPTVVINTAAATNLEWCENNQLEAFNSNVLGAKIIAQVCDAKNIYFIHFSSGCIFESKDENDLKSETDLPAPAVFYSWTKVWSEQMVTYRKSPNFRYLILRPRQPVSSQISPKNMMIKFLTFTKYVDTPNTGTVIEDLMDWTYGLIKIKPVGVLHVANEGWTTPYEMALMLKKHVLPSLEVGKILKTDLDKITPNKRVDTVLNVEKLKGLGLAVRPYKDRVEEIIIDLGKNIRSADKNLLKQILEETAETSRQRTEVNEHWKDLLK